jgi:formylglycine-generating enzyme required for sulfatase activity
MSDALQQPTWDVFISHASEDKETVARPLAEALVRRGVRVWFDAEQLTLGDSLRRSIDEGLAKSRYGLVILSKHFFAKEWPKKELDALVAREDGKAKVILPIWHGISASDIASYSPILADKLAISTVEGLEKVVSEILRVISPGAHFEPEMILIPAGEFLMGSDPGKDRGALDDEQPQHTVYLPDYYIAKAPVTNAQYAAFVQVTQHMPPIHWPKALEPQPGKENHPVVEVTWHDAVAYCRWLASITGKPYRLPSEAEWEKAARGTDGRIYPWGNQWDAKRCNSKEGGPGGTMPVGTYSDGASPYGLLDMVGNVCEWTRSLWGRELKRSDFKYPYDPADGREALVAGDYIRRAVRGGSFYNIRGRVRCAFRSGYYLVYHTTYLGFRVCVRPRQD